MEEENVRDSRETDIKTVKTMEVEESEIADYYDGFGEDLSQKDEDIQSLDIKIPTKPKIRSDINKFCKKSTFSNCSQKNMKRNKYRENGGCTKSFEFSKFLSNQTPVVVQVPDSDDECYF